MLLLLRLVFLFAHQVAAGQTCCQMSSSVLTTWASCIKHLQLLVDQRATEDVGPLSANNRAVCACLLKLEDAAAPWPHAVWKKLVQDKVCVWGGRACMEHASQAATAAQPLLVGMLSRKGCSSAVALFPCFFFVLSTFTSHRCL